MTFAPLYSVQRDQKDFHFLNQFSHAHVVLA